MGTIRDIEINKDKVLAFAELEPEALASYLRRLAGSGQISNGRERLNLRTEISDWAEAAAGYVIEGFVCLFVIMVAIVFILVVWR